MDYDKHILRVLSDVGPGGISVKRLAMHVYNMSCDMFDMPQFADVHAYVRAYLTRNSRSSSGLVERTGRWGYYRLNRSSAKTRQLLINFSGAKNDDSEADDDEPRRDTTYDNSPGLFD